MTFSRRIDIEETGAAARGATNEYALAVGVEVDRVETRPLLDSEVVCLATGQRYEVNDGIARVDQSEPLTVGSDVPIVAYIGVGWVACELAPATLKRVEGCEDELVPVVGLLGE